MEEENKERVESSGVDETQNTSNESNEPVENKATENPAIDSTAITNNVQETKASEEAAAEVKPISEELPLRSIPLTSQPDDGSVEMVHIDAIKLDNIIEDAVFETVDSAGRGSGPRFVANTDANRPVKTFLPKKGEFAIIPIGRNSDKVSEGGVVGSTMVELGFSFRFFRMKHKDQISLVLVNGKELIGYVLKGEGKGARRAFYFPKNEAEKVITLPQRGKQLKLQVAKLLVG